MKVAVERKVRNSDGLPLSDELRFSVVECGQESVFESFRGFLGYIDLPIEKPKKTVVKEYKDFTHLPSVAGGGKNIAFNIPYDADNIRLVFEVQE